MRLWKRANVEHLRIKDMRGSRAQMVLHEEVVECNVRLVTEDGEVLDLTIPDRVLPLLITDLTNVYESIHPPLNRGSRQAGWYGMEP